MKIEELARGRSEYTVILNNATHMPLMIFPRAGNLNEAIRKAVAFKSREGDRWIPVFAWEGRQESDYAYYDDEQLDYILEDKELTT